MLVLEHFVYRRGRYNVNDWNNPSRLPLGWAAIVSLAFGLLGVYLGASQQLFTGPLAKALGGMDIGFELGIAFALVAYLILRPIELRNSSPERMGMGSEMVEPEPVASEK